MGFTTGEGVFSAITVQVGELDFLASAEGRSGRVLEVEVRSIVVLLGRTFLMYLLSKKVPMKLPNLESPLMRKVKWSTLKMMKFENFKKRMMISQRWSQLARLLSRVKILEDEVIKELVTEITAVNCSGFWIGETSTILYPRGIRPIVEVNLKMKR